MVARGQKLPLTLKRVDAAPTLVRPQEPKRPYPYLEEEVTVDHKAAGVKLGGTLTKPKSGGPRFPVVLLLTGSGQQDRDEMVMGHRPFLIVADHLTRAGVAVLRLDDRGAGNSTGDFLKATQDDFVADAKAALAYLRTRPDIDTKRIGLLGHSEGGVTAPRVAADDPQVAFVVLLAGVGVPLDKLLVRQGQDVMRSMGVSEEKIKQLAVYQAEGLRVIKEVDDPAEAERKLREMNDKAMASLSPEDRKKAEQIAGAREANVKMMMTPWFRQLLRYDPAATLKKVKCPVLAICGDKDVQVAADENLPAINTALEAGGNDNVTIVELQGHNHLLQECKTGAISEYATIEQTMSPRALTVIGDWVVQHAGK